MNAAARSWNVPVRLSLEILDCLFVSYHRNYFIHLVSILSALLLYLFFLCFLGLVALSLHFVFRPTHLLQGHLLNLYLLLFTQSPDFMVATGKQPGGHQLIEGVGTIVLHILEQVELSLFMEGGLCFSYVFGFLFISLLE